MALGFPFPITHFPPPLPTQMSQKIKLLRALGSHHRCKSTSLWYQELCGPRIPNSYPSRSLFFPNLDEPKKSYIQSLHLNKKDSAISNDGDFLSAINFPNLNSLHIYDILFHLGDATSLLSVCFSIFRTSINENALIIEL